MSKPRQCPNCRKPIPLDHGFSFDKQLNLICDRCGKIAYPSNEASENAIKPVSNNSYQTYTPGGSSGFHNNGQQQNQPSYMAHEE